MIVRCRRQRNRFKNQPNHGSSTLVHGHVVSHHKSHEAYFICHSCASSCHTITCFFLFVRKEQSFGYNVDPTGKLLALPAPFTMRTGNIKDCVGPGDYNTHDKSWWAGVGSAKFSKGSRKTVFDGECAAKDRRPVSHEGSYSSSWRLPYMFQKFSGSRSTASKRGIPHAFQFFPRLITVSACEHSCFDLPPG